MVVNRTNAVSFIHMDAEAVYQLRDTAPSKLADHLRALVRAGYGRAMFSIESDGDQSLHAARHHQAMEGSHGRHVRVDKRNILETGQMRVNRAARIAADCLRGRYPTQVVEGSVTRKMVRKGGKATLSALVIVGIEAGLSVMVFGFVPSALPAS